MAADKYMEDYPVLITPAKEDSLKLGSFYDCRTSKSVAHPSGTFPPPPGPDDPKNIEKLPLRSLRYNLKHIKDTTDKTQSLAIGMSLVLKTFIGLNLDIGSVQYKTSYNSKVENDHLQIYFSLEDSVQRLLPTKPVLEALKGMAPAMSATHIVTEAFYGAHVQADILIEKTSYSKMVNKSAAGLGLLFIGPISAALETVLKAVLNNPGNSSKVTAEIDTTHEFTEGTDVNAIFRQLKKLNTVDPVPVKFLAVPIKHLILESTPASTVPLLPDFVLNELIYKMSLAKDYSPYMEEDEEGVATVKQSTHYSKQIALIDHRLHVILRCEENPITKQVKICEQHWNGITGTLQEQGKLLITGLSDGTKKLEDAVNYLEYFNRQFDHSEVKQEIANHAKQGREQLYLVQANDVDEYTEAEFAASEGMAGSIIGSYLKQRETPVMAVELFTDRAGMGGREPPPAIFLQIYSLRSPLLKVLVRFQNSSGGLFKLVLSSAANPNEKIEFSESYEDISRVLQILSVGFGTAVGSGPAARFYQAYAAKSGLALPIRGAGDVGAFHDFVTRTLNEFYNKETDKGMVQIFDTFMTLKFFLEEVDQEHRVILLPTKALVTLPDALELFIRLRGAHSGNGIHYVVGDFDLDPDNGEGPLLLVFEGGKLRSQCLGSLDFLHLENLLIYNRDITQLRHTNSTFYPDRQGSFLAIRSLFEYSYFKKPDILLHPLRLDSDVDVKKVQEVRELCEGFLDTQKQMQLMTTCLTKMLLAIDPTLEVTLDNEVGWSRTKMVFTEERIFNSDPDTRRRLRAPFLGLLSLQSDKLLKLYALSETLEYAIQAHALDNEDPYTHLIKLRHDFLDQFNEVGSESIAQVKRLLAEQIKIGNARKALSIIREDWLLHENFAVGGKGELITHLQEILSLVPQTVDADPAPENEQVKIRASRDLKMGPTLEGIVRRNVFRLPWTDEHLTNISELLDQGLVFKVVKELSTFLYPEWHKKMSVLFQGLGDYNAFGDIVNIVEEMGKEVTFEEDYPNHTIWSNPEFSHMVALAIEQCVGDSRAYSKRVLDAVATQHNLYWEIPPHIPTKIVKVLRRDLQNGWKCELKKEKLDGGKLKG